MRNGIKMKKVVMYLGWSDALGNNWSWHEEEEGSDMAPYYVEIPEDLHLEETSSGKKIYFREGSRTGYKLCIDKNSSLGSPVLVGGSPVEAIRLKVLEPAEDGGGRE